MENSLTFFTKDLFLQQSELFGEDYKNFENNSVHTFNDLTVSNLHDWQNSILQKYQLLNDRQLTNLQLLLFALTDILLTINPDKLQIKNDCITDENELLLWRESTKGISKLIFNKFGDVIYIFNGNDGKKIRGVFENNVDFEKLLYRFLSL